MPRLTTRLTSGSRRKVVVAALVAGLVLAAPAFADYVRYVHGPRDFAPGEQGTTLGWNRRTYNIARFDNPYGGLPQLGTTYIRPDGTWYDYHWSNTGSIDDYRTISYGKARCKANNYNNYTLRVSYCDTGKYG
jgi:hypothetical protein